MLNKLFNVLKKPSVSETDEQLKVQLGSNRFRAIADYDERLAVTRSRFNIRRYLDERTKKGVVRWVDVPCGIGAALQEGAEAYGLRLEAVGIDLIAWDRGSLSKIDLGELKKRYGSDRADRLLDKADFEFIRGDMKRALIPDGADFITAMCGLYYHDDPLGVWCHLFNQLRPGGTLVAHFMFPKKNDGIRRNYRRLAEELGRHFETEISFSSDLREVEEASIVTSKKGAEKIALQGGPKMVGRYRASFGRSGQFEIKVVEYDLEPQVISLIESTR